jgi:hypothetical protein
MIPTTGIDHDWPIDPDEHVWGKWMSKSRTVEYRTCVHPACSAVETREAARA